MSRNALVYPHTLSPFVRRWVLSSFFLCLMHSFFFLLTVPFLPPFRRVLSLLAFSNTILRAHEFMLTLFTIYSFAVFQIDLLYALRYCSLQQNGYCYFHFEQYSEIQSWFKIFIFYMIAFRRSRNYKVLLIATQKSNINNIWIDQSIKAPQIRSCSV